MYLIINYRLRQELITNTCIRQCHQSVFKLIEYQDYLNNHVEENEIALMYLPENQPYDSQGDIIFFIYQVALLLHGKV